MGDDCKAEAARVAFSKMPTRSRPSAGVSMEARCGEMSSIVDLIAGQVEGPVIDKTGLSGKWEFQIYFDSPKLLAHDPP